MNTLCVYCQQPLKFGQESIGREFDCPRCKRKLLIDGTGIVAPPAPNAPPQQSNAFQSIADDDDDDEPVRSVRRMPRTRKKSRGGNGFADFLMFRAMLTPWIIQAVFWVGSILFVSAGLMKVANSFEKERPAFAGFDADRFGNPIPETKANNGGMRVSETGIALGLSLCIFGPLLMRLYCEGMIIFFRIHEELCDLHTTMARKA